MVVCGWYQHIHVYTYTPTGGGSASMQKKQKTDTGERPPKQTNTSADGSADFLEPRKVDEELLYRQWSKASDVVPSDENQEHEVEEAGDVAYKDMMIRLNNTSLVTEQDLNYISDIVSDDNKMYGNDMSLYADTHKKVCMHMS